MAKKPTPKLVPTVTIGGAPASYKPQTLKPTVTIGGAPAGYRPTPTSVIPSSTTTRATPGQFRKAEEASNLTGPIQYAPTIESINKLSDIVTPLDEKGNFNENLKEDEKVIDSYMLDAYALLESIFRSYGLESLVPVIRGYMEQNLGIEQAKLKLKTEQAYKDRFKGNEIRLAKGLNVIGEAEYLELENDYSETLRAYGISDYFGVATDSTSRLARQQKMAEVIGNDISATEFKDRIKTAVSRVKDADKNTKDAFKALYGIDENDLVRYFLDPTQGSEQLRTKATAAEISGAAVSTGLAGTSLGTAEELAKLGVDKSTALTGYTSIAGFLPRAEFLGQVYDETGIKYDRASAEAETFKGLASEKRKREQLAALEEAQFGGSSGRLRTGRATENQGAF